MRKFNCDPHTYKDDMREIYIYGCNLSSKYEFPVLDQITRLHMPSDTVVFEKIPQQVRKADADMCVNFYQNDTCFERVWSRASDYIGVFKRYSCIIEPDFSLDTKMPRSMIQWNRYRNNALAYYYSRQGITVIPSLQVLTPDLVELCASGIPKHSILAVSTTSHVNTIKSRRQFCEVLSMQLEILKPEALMMFGYIPKEYKPMCKTYYYDTDVKKRNER